MPYEAQKRDIMAMKSVERQKKALGEYTNGLLAQAHVRYL